MRKLLIFALAGILLLTGCVTVNPPASPETPVPTVEPTPEPVADMPNPWVDYASYEGMFDSLPEINMADAPKGSTDVHYRSLTGDHPIAEIRFTLDGKEYVYRAAPCASIMQITDISGLYTNFDVNRTVTASESGYPVEFALAYSTSSGLGHTTWFDADSKCQYDLSAPVPQDKLIEVSGELALMDVNLNAVTGTVTMISKSELTLHMENGNILHMPLKIVTDAEAGDTVKIVYCGTIGQDDFEVLDVEVTSHADSFTGDIVQVKGNTFIAKSGNIGYDFVMDPSTAISGGDLKPGAVCEITFKGVLEDSPVAISIDILSPAPEEEDPLINKTLKGEVIALSRGSFKIVTSKGKHFKFIRTSDTEYTGKYDLEVGCRVQVTYDGYASDAPDAKIVKVIEKAPAPVPEPTSEPVKKYTVEGSINATNGIWIILDDGETYEVNSAHCKIHNPELCQIGNIGTFKYYFSGSKRIVVDAKFMPGKVY